MVGQILPLTTLLYLALAISIYNGQVITSVVVAWIASPVIFFCYALRYEKQKAGRGETTAQVAASVFNPKRQAWSFLFGDLIVLPAVFGVIAHAWSQRSIQSFTVGWIIWLFASLAIGSLAGLIFHFVIDKPAYESKGFSVNLDSPTKWIHDMVTYPVLAGAIVFALPVVVSDNGSFGWHEFVIFGLLVTWAFLGMVIDEQRGKTLVPWGHPPFDLERGEVITHTSH